MSRCNRGGPLLDACGVGCDDGAEELQPVLAAQLRNRKLANIARSGGAIVATGNIGCIQQLEAGLDRPILHTVELLDWATGGPRPVALGPEIESRTG